MSRIKRSNEFLWVLSTILVALGVAICGKADLGVSMIAAPSFVVSEFLAANIHPFFNVGVTEYILQGMLLTVLCLVIRRFNWRYLLSFAIAVIYGYTLNLFIWILSDIRISNVLLRWGMLLVGDCITALGVACFFRTYMPLQVYELFVAEVSRVFKITIGKTKWCFDIALLTVSIVLALVLFRDVNTLRFSNLLTASYHSIGLGTLLTTAINSPIITLMGKLIDKMFDPTPMFPKLNKLLERS